MSTSEQHEPQGAVGIPQWTLGDRLRKSLAASGVSVQEMADHLELNRVTVGNYMAGRSTPLAATIRTWALRVGVPYEWVRFGKAGPESGPGLGIRPLSWIARGRCPQTPVLLADERAS